MDVETAHSLPDRLPRPKAFGWKKGIFDACDPDRSQTAQSRNLNLDLMRCVGAMAVVYVHWVGFYTYQFDDLVAWSVADIVNAMSRFCVPIFIMISGALIVGRPINAWGQFYRRRLLSVLKPYFLGSLIYLLYQIYHDHTPPVSAVAYCLAFIQGGSYFDLYFLPALFGIYILAPCFQGISPKMGPSIVAAVMFLLAMEGIQRLVLFPLGATLGEFTVVAEFLPYFLAGYMMFSMIEVSVIAAVIMFLSASAGIAIAVAVSCMLAGGHRNNFIFEEYDSPFVIVQSLAIFALLLKVRVTPLLGRAVQVIAPLSLGIYILHMLILNYFTEFLFTHFQMPHLVMLLLVPPVVFIMSAVITRLLHFIPGVKGFV